MIAGRIILRPALAIIFRQQESQDCQDVVTTRMEPMNRVTMGDCESASDDCVRQEKLPAEEDLKKEDHDSGYLVNSSYTNSWLLKVLILLGCLLLVTSTLLAILDAPRHHQRVYAENYSNIRISRQEDALLWSESDNRTQVTGETAAEGKDAFTTVNETATDKKEISSLNSANDVATAS